MSLIVNQISTTATFSEEGPNVVAVSQDGTIIHITLDDPVLVDAVWAPVPVVGLPQDSEDNPRFSVNIIDETHLEITAIFDISSQDILSFNLVALEEPDGDPIVIDPQLILEPDDTGTGSQTLIKQKVAATG